MGIKVVSVWYIYFHSIDFVKVWKKRSLDEEKRYLKMEKKNHGYSKKWPKNKKESGLLNLCVFWDFKVSNHLFFIMNEDLCVKKIY